ncbi:PQQ-dependent sugar dehydrogenase [Dasania sp. GY-MA-18]|uniref:PQQ-dependent sugar dehydrogenase n=1 Tax=Dasania phycosphaerae TaxID=2950436 RepID=A0A9J6RN03_9GAMM|nr:MULTISPECIES: PQQ-dependent sugar dehydrogenase [Dasania]MCR8923257.1 PQQ-dependent sugar dehydrogenase [Dasania sp. GY-MA-18]MCZ0865689.1 PQQ-dependent sugar dehydrogenase [Dasania phycosphaerae]MCZ0869414.1 PQQ-dependent sugar dehydrogenase [Dasania phycosphaerae]
MSQFLKRVLLSLLAVVVLLLLTAKLWLGEEFETSAKVLLNTVAGYSVASPSQQQVDQRFTVPPGFRVTVYASDLGKVRMLEMSPAGDLLASQPRKGTVTILGRDNNRDGLPDNRRVLLAGLTRPHGLELVDGWLYVAESNQIGRIAFDAQSGQVQGDYQVLIKGLSDSGNHWTKSLRAGDDGWLYVSSGSSCNVCVEEDEQRAAISRFKLADQNPRLELFASGLRNSVGMDWSPWEQALYATDNGRDLLGDDYPPCELNRIVKGGFYGWPYINGYAELDPDLGQGREDLLNDAISPVHGFRAHNAPLGMRFISAGDWPAQFHKTALVALHGSWNRSSRDGYKVVSLHWQPNGKVIERDFMSGFLRSDMAQPQGESVIGRPVDIAQGEDGAVYISDDYSGTVFKVVYSGESEPLAASYGANAKTAVQVKVSGASSLELQQQGAAVFKHYHCASCHDARYAQANRPVRPLENLASRYTAEGLQDFLLSPTPPMPLYPLSEQQRIALAAYLLNR